MAYETGTASSQQDLLDKLKTFAVAQGWTQDEFDTTNKRLSIHKGTVFVQFRWDAADSIAIYHSLGFTGGNAPGNHPNDSGNGLTGTGTINAQRRISAIGNGPYPAYYFFAGTNYIHVVLEFVAGRYRHASFGELIKTGVWTGGEYAAGFHWGSLAAQVDDLGNVVHYALVDWRNNADNLLACTVHAEGFPGQAVGGKWGVVINSNTTGNDRAGVLRLTLIGGVREGFLQNALGWLRANPANGFIPMIPLEIYYRRALTPEHWFKFGYVPDIKQVNMFFLNPAEEFTVGADVWKVFPWARKQFLQNDTEESGSMAFAYKKVV